MGEIGGSIQGIDVPAVFGRSLLPAAFFGDDRMRWEMGLQALDDQLFAGAIGFGDQVEIALQLEADAPFEVIPR